MPSIKIRFFFVSAMAALGIIIGSKIANAQIRNTANDGDSRATRFGIGLSAGIPTPNSYKFAYGGDLRLQQDFTSNVSGLLSAGYNTFSSDLSNFQYIPLKVGLKVFPVQRFYFSGEIGAGFPTRNGAKTAFVYAPGVGVGTNSGIDIGLRYEGMTSNAFLDLKNPSQVAVRLAYGFKL